MRKKSLIIMDIFPVHVTSAKEVFRHSLQRPTSGSLNMIDSSRKGYAVMDPKLSGYYFEHEEFERCKNWCKNGKVIVELLPKHVGYNITFYFAKFWKPFYFKTYSDKNILWFHWRISKRFHHKTGKIVYRSEKGE